MGDGTDGLCLPDLLACPPKGVVHNTQPLHTTYHSVYIILDLRWITWTPQAGNFGPKRGPCELIPTSVSLYPCAP